MGNLTRPIAPGKHKAVSVPVLGPAIEGEQTVTKRLRDHGDARWEASAGAAAATVPTPTRRRAPNAETMEAMQEPVGDLPVFDSVQALFDDLHADDKV